MEKITIIKDTREKKGYEWEETDWCDGYTIKKLDVGDYSIVGYEKILTIERKASTNEFANNVIEARFDRELVKMQEFPYSFLLFEFSYEDLLKYPMGSGIPKFKQKYIKIKGEFLVKKMLEYQMIYNTKILFAGSKYNGWQLSNSIFKRTIELCPISNSQTTI